MKIRPTVHSPGNIGNNVIENAINGLYFGDNLKSFEYIIAGIEMITNDGIGNHTNEYRQSRIPEIFTDKNPSQHVNFLKAFYYSRYFKNDAEKLSLGLKSINQYLKMRPCKYGYYIKGITLLSLNELNKANLCLKKSRRIGNLKATTYQIGLLKMKEKYEFGLIELIEAFLGDPCDVEVNRNMHQYWKRLIKMGMLTAPQIDDNQKELVLISEFFNPSSQFYKTYLQEVLWKENSFELVSLLNSQNESTVLFFKFIRDSLLIFKEKEVEITRNLKNYESNKVFGKRNLYDKADTDIKYADSLDYEEVVMKALRNGQGDKLGY